MKQKTVNQKTAQLPERASLMYTTPLRTKLYLNFIEIVDHKIRSGPELLEASMSCGHPLSWNEWVEKMIKCGFSFDAVIEEYVKCLQDPYRFKRILRFFQRNYEFMDDERDTRARSPAGRIFARDIELELRKCRNWDELGYIFLPNSRFRKFIRNRMDEEFEPKPEGNFLKRLIKGIRRL